jgi:hypothetical protein
VKDKKSVFYCSSFVFIVNVVLLVSFEAEATTSQQPTVVANHNFSSTTTDAIDKAVKGMATNNIDKLMSETILPVLTNSSTSRILITGNNQTVGKTPVSELKSIDKSDVISNNQSQKDVQIQNGVVAKNVGENNNSSPVFTMDHTPQLNPANNARAIADNGTILLQFQNPTDIDIVNRLEKIETIIQEYTKKNDVNSTVKSIGKSNAQILNELSEIKSEISGSSVLPAVTAKSIGKSNAQILNELSEIKSSISGSSFYNLISGIVSGTLVAGIVSAVAVFVLLKVYNDGGLKLSELKLRRRKNSNYT